jgi:hypothetical protein
MSFLDAAEQQPRAPGNYKEALGNLMKHQWLIRGFSHIFEPAVKGGKELRETSLSIGRKAFPPMDRLGCIGRRPRH